MKSTQFFLHGLESSSKGTKGRWFAEHFPKMIIPDFSGDLSCRVQSLKRLCGDLQNITLIGSSFGGLMATIFAMEHAAQCSRLILLAPALNFPEFVLPAVKIAIPTKLIIGEHDTVTPPDRVLPLARKVFLDLDVSLCGDDHMLHKVFYELNWKEMLGEKA
jgi:pimeloyl-ACP methyl ester carboxylesterase